MVPVGDARAYEQWVDTHPIVGVMRPPQPSSASDSCTGLGSPGLRASRPGSPTEHFRARQVGGEPSPLDSLGTGGRSVAHPGPGDLARSEGGQKDTARPPRNGICERGVGPSDHGWCCPGGYGTHWRTEGCRCHRHGCVAGDADPYPSVVALCSAARGVACEDQRLADGSPKSAMRAGPVRFSCCDSVVHIDRVGPEG